MKTKVQRKYIDHSLGFPIVILNAPLIKTRGQWALRVNYNRYQETILALLAHKPGKLTGSEVQFIRKHFQMTLRQFADRFSIRHPAVIKWENARGNATKMAWTTEKDLRLFILDELKKRAREFQSLYKALKEEAKESAKPIEIDAAEIAA